MKGKIKNTFIWSFVTVNIIVVISMIITGFGGYADPRDYPYIAVSTLAFPIALAVNISFILFWIIFRFRYTIIPIAGLLICYMPVRTYFPINKIGRPPLNALKVMSYNLCSFREYDYPEGEKNPIVNYLQNSGADIICIQESTRGERIKKLFKKQIDKTYPYQEFVDHSGNSIAILSKYPILSSERIEYESAGNLSNAWKLDIDGDTIIVINNHLESNKLSLDDRKKFKKLVKDNFKDKEAKEDSKELIKKLADATKIRSKQADEIAKYIRKDKNRSLIVCGDFNDSPLSYTRRVISKDLKDCYIESGNGLGISYHTGGFYVRIDNIMCSDDWDVYKCEIDSKITTSDHYPIISWIKKR